MNILSLFDGMSCGQIALQRAGISYENYFASEIDPYGIQVTKKNYPDTIHIGSITDLVYYNGYLMSPNTLRYVGKIDLLIGGSPCQGFSIAGKQLNFDDPRSKLFFEYVRLLEEIKAWNPDVKFLLENVKMKQQWQDVISEYLGVQPVEINSARVSAQNRVRLYWANFEITQPEEIVPLSLESILEPKYEVDPKYWLSQKERNYMDRETRDGRTHWDFSQHSDTENMKSVCLTANMHKGVPYNVLIDRRGNKCFAYECDFQDSDMCAGCVDLDNHQYENYPSATIRKFLPVELERLQTVPDGYTAGVSNTQRYKMLGNGWTVDVIAHIFSCLKRSV